MGPPGVRHMIVTGVWAETWLTLLGKAVPDVPFAFLGRASSFEPRFESLRTGAPDPAGLLLPWPEPSGQRFWQFYFEGRRSGDVTGRQAWKGLVPFRMTLPLRIEADWLPGRSLGEAFFFPHGHALVASFHVDVGKGAALPLTEAVNLAQTIRSGGRFTVTLPGEAAQELKLEALAGAALAWIRKTAVGPGAQAGPVSPTPFTVVTFAKLEDVDPAVSPPAEGEVHRALEALTEWSTGWQLAQLRSFENAKLKTKDPLPSDVLYHGRRGRAVWFPHHAVEPEKHTLGCYHRNLVFASLQVESLGRFLSETVNAGYRGAAHDECAKHAAGILGRLYGGAGSVYRTRSALAHLDENDLVPALDAVRDRFGMAKVAQKG